MTERVKKTAIALLLAAGVAACDKVPLLAPTNSTINLSASTRVLPFNGTAQLTAFVTESSGTPVQNGTTVRFTTTLGRVDPVETQTRNGSVTVTFLAGTSSGVAEIRALSGASGGGTSGTGTGTGTTTSTAQNVVQITIGTAAIKAVTLRANPGTVGPAGGPVELIATVVGDTGNGLQGIPVTFNADQGVLSVQTVPTDANGEARTVLTTTQKTSVTATAGIVTSTPATVVDVRLGPGVSIACATTAGGGVGTTCAAIQATPSNTATVQFTVTKGTGTSSLRDATIDFGDGTAQGLGNLAGGPVIVTHAYNGPSGSSPRTYTATVRATDVNGETATVIATVAISPRAPLSVTLSSTSTTPTGGDTTVAFTATVKPDVGGADVVQSYTWDFDVDSGNGPTATTSGNSTSHVYSKLSGRKVVTVTVQTTDGRSATGRTEVNIP